MSDNNCTVLNKSNVEDLVITPLQYNNILNIQQEILSLTAYENDTLKILNRLCDMAEEMLPNAVASLMLKDESTQLLNVKAAPSVPKVGWTALNGLKPGPKSGSCGNAVYTGESQFIVNTFEDERGEDFKPIAKDFNLCSCWSMPVKDKDNNIIGSFALSSFEHRTPSSFHKKLLETASTIATIVLKNETNKQKIENMMYRDSLTGLKNKTMLQKDLIENKFYTLIFIDLNNFSYVNTAYGFDIADKILIKTANAIQNIFSQNIYRINADQFAIKFDNKIDINEQVDKIRTFFYKELITVGEVKIKISFSYGGVYANKNLMKHAALAIKKAKESGKNRLYIFNKDSDSSKNRQLFIDMNNTIHHAFDEDRIVPYFQGIYDNSKKEIKKFEALVRIVNRDGTIISPFSFLDVAKHSGLLPKLTKRMIDKTFEVMSTNNYDFSMNITEDDLNNEYLFNYLNVKSKEYNIKPYRVTLEILEGISSFGQKSNLAQLKELKQSGYKLAIDDFGAEYSNFERVLELNVDFLKIDARYIKNIDTDKRSYEIVKAIVNFASNMYITTVAEFVHSKSVQKIVQDLGITYSQGYYFSEPTDTVDTEPINS